MFDRNYRKGKMKANKRMKNKVRKEIIFIVDV